LIVLLLCSVPVIPSKATAQAESNSFRTLRARVTFAARHPWRPPFGPSLRDVKNFSRKFFVLVYGRHT